MPTITPSSRRIPAEFRQQIIEFASAGRGQVSPAQPSWRWRLRRARSGARSMTSFVARSSRLRATTSWSVHQSKPVLFVLLQRRRHFHCCRCALPVLRHPLVAGGRGARHVALLGERHFELTAAANYQDSRLGSVGQVALAHRCLLAL